MFTIKHSREMRRNMKLMKRRGADMSKLADVLRLLKTGEPLPPQYCDHALKGKWIGHRECHIEPDWLLVYKIYKNKLILLTTNTGTHSDLFGW